MKHPWETIRLEDYEKHMELESVRQLQTLNAMMREQLAAYPAATVMILGVAGGNGLEHVDREKTQTVYGVDVNADYLRTAEERHPELRGVLRCICADLTKDADKLPAADVVIADLLVEYIGCTAFRSVIETVKPEHVSCVVQTDGDAGAWVSDSPYTHCFDCLETIHRPVEPDALRAALGESGYREIFRSAEPLPNGKKLERIDFRRK